MNDSVDELAHELLEAAERARMKAYAPYSGFTVGAAVATSAPRQIFTGCNIENASYSVALCAERVAIFNAVAAGFRDLAAIAVVVPEEARDDIGTCISCGACRQVMSEFMGVDALIIVGQKAGYRLFTLNELLPTPFRLNTMK